MRSDLRPGGEPTPAVEANDGAPQEYHVIQAGEVRLQWVVLPGTWGPRIDEFAVLLDSLGVTTAR